MKYSFQDLKISTHGEDYFIAPTASVIGQVKLARNSSIWFGSTVRGDNEPILLGEGSNVQDNCVLHTDPGHPIILGKNTSIGHMVMLHGCFVDEYSLVGIGSTILNGAKIGKFCLIGANTLITEGKVIPDRSVVMGSPGKIIRQATDRDMEIAAAPAPHYIKRSKLYRENLTETQ